jgi:hypothetical protein
MGVSTGIHRHFRWIATECTNVLLNPTERQALYKAVD